MGYAGRGHHAPVTHDAGLHLLEPLDRHGKLQLLVAVLRILQVINSVCVCVCQCLLGLSYSLLACALWPMVAFVVPEHQLGTAYGL